MKVVSWQFVPDRYKSTIDGLTSVSKDIQASTAASHLGYRDRQLDG